MHVLASQFLALYEIYFVTKEQYRIRTPIEIRGYLLCLGYIFTHFLKNTHILFSNCAKALKR